MKHPEKVWQYTSKNPGKNIVVIGGMHGNELTGIRVVDQLREILKIQKIKQGTLTLIHGNPKAIIRNARGSQDHADLNRAFLEDEFTKKHKALYEYHRARELAPYLKEADIVVDLHATNKPSDPFSVISSNEASRTELADFFPANNILVYSPELLPGTSLGYTEMFGGISIAYESGQATDVTKVESTLKSVESLLRVQGVLDGDVRVNTGNQDIHEVVTDIHLTPEGFQFFDGRGKYSFEPFKAGEILGWRGEDKLHAEFDGVMMFPKIPELWKEGKPVVSLAKQVDRK